MLFWLMFLWGSVHLEILSTHITKPAGSLWLFMRIRQLGQWLVKCVENILRQNWKSQNTFKNSMYFFLLSGNEIKIYFIGSFPSSPTYLIKNLGSTALEARQKYIFILLIDLKNTDIQFYHFHSKYLKNYS